MLRPLLWIIAVSQLVLATLTLFSPIPFFAWMGLTAPAPDNGYMIGMLGARFLAYGIGMAMLARAKDPSRFWIANMALIQAVDLALAVAYVSAGIVPWEVAAFPAMNAALFSVCLVWCLRAPGLKAA